MLGDYEKTKQDENERVAEELSEFPRTSEGL